MGTTTTNYNIFKAATTDVVDVVADINNGFDIIDSTLAGKASTAALNAHTAATTSVHGITDTTKIALINAANTFTLLQTVLAIAATGLTGATTNTRYVGGTSGNHPITGTFALGDFVVDATGSFWICTVAGSPGTWVQVGSGGVSAGLGANTFTGEQTAPDFKTSGITGTSVARFVGSTAGGAPSSGTFSIGDFVVDTTGKIFVCTSGGTSGTWLNVASLYALLGIANTFTAEQTAPDFKITGITGATATSSRYAGATSGGAPASGTFVQGDFIVDITGKFFICTTSGTPGTWLQVSGGALVCSIKIANYTLVSSDDVIIYNGSGAATFTIPAAGTAAVKPIIIKNLTASVLTIGTAGGNIDGATTYSISSANNSITLVPVAGNWYLV